MQAALLLWFTVCIYDVESVFVVSVGCCRCSSKKYYISISVYIHIYFLPLHIISNAMQSFWSDYHHAVKSSKRIGFSSCILVFFFILIWLKMDARFTDRTINTKLFCLNSKIRSEKFLVQLKWCSNFT